MDKMREEFEAWWSSTGHSGFVTNIDGNYVFSHTQAAWISWKASRAALCVELPVWTLKNGADYFDYHKADDVKAICEEAGASYK